jgi:hypothetical protein
MLERKMMASTREETQATRKFTLPILKGPALLAGQRLTVGDSLVHAEYGPLEIAGYGWTNGALGHYLKLVGDEDAPEKWSFDRGGPNSLPDAFAANRLSLGGEIEGRQPR